MDDPWQWREGLTTDIWGGDVARRIATVGLGTNLATALARSHETFFLEAGVRIDPIVRLMPGHADLPDGTVQFDALLPEAFADGEQHSIRVLTATGAELSGSPLTFCHNGGGISHC